MLNTLERHPLTLRRAALAAAVIGFSILIGPSGARAQVPPPAVTPVNIGASSVTWNWTLTPNATGYRVLLTSSTSTPETNISGDLSGATNSFIQVGLSTNAVYGIMVEAFGVGFTVDSATTTVLTAAAAPSGTMLLATNNSNQVSLSWVTDGNPAGVTYNVNWSTGTGVGILFSTNPFVNVVTGSAAATIFDLPGGQTINLDVQAVNSSGVVSGFDVIVTTTIPVLANQPVISSATFAAGVSSITWYWSASTGAIAYQLFTSTNGAASPILSSTTLNYTQTGLSTNTLYTDYVFAYSVPSSTTSAPYTQYTLAAPTTGLTLTGLSGPSLSTPTVSEFLSWGANGNPVGTNYNVLWWTNLTSTVTFSTGTTSALVGGLYGGSTIYFTVQTVNFAGSTATYDSTFFTTVPSTSFAVGAQNLPVGYSGLVTFVVPNIQGSGSGVITVRIASGTFTSAVTLNVSTPALNAAFPTVGGPVADLPNPIHLTLSALDAFGVPQQPGLPVILSVNYAASNLAANQTTLSICRYDNIRQVWIPLATAKLGTALIASTDHFSSFAVLSVASGNDLSSISVGPNPLRPVLNPGSVMTFRNLPAACRVRIFSYVGEKIVDMVADGSGIVAWNGRNHVGSLVASGVYIALIEGAGVKKTMRVAIER